MIANGVVVQRKLGEIVAEVTRLRYVCRERAAAMQHTIRGWHWRERALEYFRLFDEAIECRDTSRPVVRTP